MPTLLFAALAAVVGAWAIASLVRRHAETLQLVQVANERSSHVTPTPSGGGLGIAIPGLVIGASLGADAPLAWAAIATAGLATIIGLLDDRFEISSLARIVLHIGMVVALLYVAGPLPELQGSWTVLPMPLLYLFIGLAGVWWINLFNFMDGIDGIASSEAITILLGAIVVAAIGGTLSGAPWAESWAVIISAACFGFVLLNWPPAKIFMGDVGSNFLAVAIFAIFLQFLAGGTVNYGALLILPALFVTDATVTLSRRIAEGQRWFAAHRLHAYQKLSRRWQSHKRVTALAIGINVCWLLPLAILAQLWADWSPLLVIVAYIPLILGCVAAGAGRNES